MMESEQILLLQKWDDYLAAQGVHFDTRIVNLTGHPHVPDEQSVAFLQVDDELAKPEIEKATGAFIRDSSWPALDYRQCLHLAFRAHVARCVIREVLQGSSVGITMEAGLPDLKNRTVSLQWFLVDLWNRGGQKFLAAMADDWLKRPRA